MKKMTNLLLKIWKSISVCKVTGTLFD